MKVLLLVDSFKGSMSSDEVNGYLELGLKSENPHLDIVKIPISDGGEGFVDSMIARGGKKIYTKATGPLGKTMDSFYGVSCDETTAYIEVAAAIGLYLIDEVERNPLKTSSYGVGELVMNAIHRGYKKIIIGLGGSSTNDGGMGMARALGIKFKDQYGNELSGMGYDLEKVSSIDTKGLDPMLKNIEFVIACDVDNPLIGGRGATHVFARQKGADEETVLRLEAGMENYRKIILNDIGIDVQKIVGAGAAGGLCAAIVAYLHGNTKPGIELIIQENKIEDIVSEVDLIITGEGKFDSQTLYGKAPMGVLTMGKKYNKKVIAIAGKVDLQDVDIKATGFDDILCITPNKQALNEAMKMAKENTLAIAKQIYKDYIKEC